MSLAVLFRRLRMLLRPDADAAGLEEEMRLHVELRASRLRREGWGEAEAEREARRRFGDTGRHLDASRDAWGVSVADAWLQDVRYAWKALRSARGTSLAIILVMAVVIGANTAIFGVLHALFLQRLPLPEPQELVAFTPMRDGRQHTLLLSDFEQVRRPAGVPPLEAYRFDRAWLGDASAREAVWVDHVTPGWFELLGARAMLGRTLGVADAGNKVAVVSHRVWRTHLQADSAAVGQTLRVNGEPVLVVGVMPPFYTGVHAARQFSLAMPIDVGGGGGPPDFGVLALHMIGRVPPGLWKDISAVVEGAFLSCCVTSRPTPSGVVRARQNQRDSPIPEDAPTGWSKIQAQGKHPHVVITDASRGLIWSRDYRGTYGVVLLALMGGVVILLLIAVANAGALLLARAVTRQREFAVRAAMGAGAARLARQLLAESLLLSAAGGVVGLVLARLGTVWLQGELPPELQPLQDVIAWKISPALLVFTAVLTTVGAVLFGVWPAIEARRADLLSPLQGSPRGGSGWSTSRIHRGLAVVQIALALVLVFTASLLTSTLRNLKRIEAAEAAHSVVVRVDGEHGGYADAGQLADDVLAVVSASSGVRNAAAMIDLPLVGDMWAGVRVRPLDVVLPEDLAAPRFNAVTSSYFDVAPVRILHGRGFLPSDHREAEAVAVLSKSLALQWFGSTLAVNRMLRVSDSMDVRIVGVAADVAYDDPRTPATPMWAMPLAQAPGGWTSLVLVAKTDDAGAAAVQIRTALASHGRVRLVSVMPYSVILNGLLARERLAAALGALFGGIALVLAIAGVHALLSHGTSRRAHEIGVRMAMGARPWHTVRLVVGQAVGLVLIAYALGVPAAVAATHLIRAQLYGLPAADPRVLVWSALLVGAGAVAGALIPAARAARVDPATALRE